MQNSVKRRGGFMKLENQTIKNFLSIISKLQLEDFAVVNGVFGKDLFGKLVVIKLNKDVSFHVLSQKHAKTIALFTSNSEYVDIISDDNECKYVFYDSNDKKISQVRIPNGAFELSNSSVVSKIDDMNIKYLASFTIPAKVVSKLVEIVNDIASIKLTKKDDFYCLVVNYYDNVSEVNITPIEIKEELLEELELPVSPFLYSTINDTATLYVSRDNFMIKVDNNDVSLYILSSFNVSEKDINKLVSDINIDDLL